MIKLFLKFEFEKISKYFRTKKTAKIITSLLFLLVFLFVGSGIYFFFISGFRYINVEAVEDIRIALTLFIYEVFLAVLSSIVIFSVLVSGIFNLFRGGNNNWVISTPSYKIFPFVIIIRSFFGSIIPSVVLFLPAILAYSRINNLGFLSIIFILFSVFLLLIMLNLVTLLIIISLGNLYYFFSKKIKMIHFNLKGLIMSIIVLVFFVIFFVWKTIKDIDIVKLFKADVLTDTLSASNIGNHFIFLPTHPLAMEIISWQNGDLVKALMYFSELLLLVSFFIFLWLKISPKFYPLWQKLQEGNSQIQIKDRVVPENKMSYHFNGGKTLALFKKESLISSRNMKGLLWFLFLFLIWLAQVGTSFILNKNIQKYELDISQKTAILQSLQFIIAIYFISSFSLRFVFPSFSVEKKTRWILASAPISFKKIFYGKYLFYASFFSGLGLIMGYVNAKVLHLSFTHALHSMILFISVVILIITSGLLLGAIFPNTESDDPEIISTSMSGLFFTAFSLIYGAMSSIILYITLTNGTLVYLTSFITFTLLMVVVLLLKVPKTYKF